MDLPEVFGGGQNALSADEPADLKEQRKKCREEDEAEGSEKEPARDEVVCDPFVAAEEISICALDGMHRTGAGSILMHDTTNPKWSLSSHNCAIGINPCIGVELLCRFCDIRKICGELSSTLHRIISPCVLKGSPSSDS